MTALFSFPRKVELSAAAPRSAARPGRLARTFVETGDERCPLAGIWSRLADCDTATHSPEPDDPEIAWPAMPMLLWWRAFHPLFAVLQ